MKKIILMISLTAFSIPALFAANMEQKPVEIPGRREVQIEKAEEIRPVKKIEEKPGVVMPELPKPLKEGKPSEAEQLKIGRVEQAEATASINPGEAAIEKDNQRRDANLKF